MDISLIENIASLIGGLVVVHFSASRVIRFLSRVAKFFGFKEFIVALFLMAMAASLPNFFLGITSSLQGNPELSFGDILGGNVIDLTLVIALAVLLSRKNLPVKGVLIDKTIVFASLVVSLPVFLSFDNVLSRSDGVILLLFFAIYTYWIFSSKERFKKVYEGVENSDKKSSLEKKETLSEILSQVKIAVKNIGGIFLYTILLILASKIIVDSSLDLTGNLNISVISVGLLIVALGNSMPELYFSLLSAIKNKTEIIIGDLIGAVIIPSTLVLGIVLIIHPIYLNGAYSFFIARIFTVLVAVFFLIGALTGKVVTKKEALFLMFIYMLFVMLELSY